MEPVRGAKNRAKQMMVKLRCITVPELDEMSLNHQDVGYRTVN